MGSGLGISLHGLFQKCISDGCYAMQAINSILILFRLLGARALDPRRSWAEQPFTYIHFIPDSKRAINSIDCMEAQVMAACELCSGLGYGCM